MTLWSESMLKTAISSSSGPGTCRFYVAPINCEAMVLRGDMKSVKIV
jgi:hypothetical protein